MDRARSVVKIVGVGLVVAVAALLLLNWINGQTVHDPDVGVDRYGNLLIDGE